MSKQAEVGEAVGTIEAVVVPAGGGETYGVFGVQVDVLIPGERTGGAFATYRASMEAGVGSPPHVHQWDDETFYVLEGTFEFRAGDRTHTLGPGGQVFLPRGLPHYFKNVGGGRGSLLGVCTPGGHERFFADASRLAMPPDMAEALAVCRRHGIELLPPDA